MAHTTATITHEVMYFPNRLPDILKTLNCRSEGLIRVAMLPQSAEDKLALNRFHRYIRKKLLTHINNKWSANSIVYQNQAAAAAPPFGNLLKGSKIGGLHHYRLVVKEI
ncbi:hypothetical protein Zmor_008890 [Zophobas morio]|jgi:hypothetical protein|uniref:Uncharacterized protein n=1 Tax=Zophobas morio TaxID=2755281 RepID=A0AA38M0K5_9CUCU|nr:hypothetical protein Zmor_008890 [Zophobas morio]